jgi:hypothetical protein
LPQSIQVVDLGFNVDSLDGEPAGRLARPSLIVIDQAKYARQSIQFGQQTVVVEIGSAMQDNERPSVADFSDIELRIWDWEVTLIHMRLVASSIGGHDHLVDVTGLTNETKTVHQTGA